VCGCSVALPLTGGHAHDARYLARYLDRMVSGAARGADVPCLRAVAPLSAPGPIAGRPQLAWCVRWGCFNPDQAASSWWSVFAFDARQSMGVRLSLAWVFVMLAAFFYVALRVMACLAGPVGAGIVEEGEEVIVVADGAFQRGAGKDKLVVVAALGPISHDASSAAWPLIACRPVMGSCYK